MPKFMTMCRIWAIIMMFSWALGLPVQLSAEEPFSVNKIVLKATGTGFTTGHVADLEVRNKNKGTMTILAQRVFIPSTGGYQPYIADIPATVIPSGSTVIIPLTGYCTDEHLPAAPSTLELIPIEKWIPIRSSDTTSVKGVVLLVSNHSVLPFTKDHITYILSASAYKPLYPPSDTLHLVTWPGTDILAGGTFDHVKRPDLFATIISKALTLLDSATTAIQQEKNYSTPFSINPAKEKEAIIQQMLWMYSSALAGRKYGKEEFSIKVNEQYKSHLQMSDVPALEKQELQEGIDEFWNLFLAVIARAHLFQNKETITTHGRLVDVSMDTIPYPWSSISLTDVMMKPHYVKVVPVKVSSPVIPILAGSASAGSLLFIAFHQHNDTVPVLPCDFTISLFPLGSTCQLPIGAVSLMTSVEGSYSYIWSNGATTQNLESVLAGDYTVTVTRVGTSCSQSGQVTINNIDDIYHANITSQDAHCGQQDGSAIVTVAPSGEATYLWSTGSTEPSITNIGAGTYVVTVTLEGACKDTAMVTINDLSTPFSDTILVTPSKCGGADGQALVIVSPEEAVYSFAWSTGASTQGISGLVAGSYSVTVTHVSSGCTKIKNFNVPDLPISFSIANISTTDASCGLANGTASAIVDPSGSYIYAWSNGQSTEQISDLSPGSYSVIVSQSGTVCADTGQFTIQQLPPAFSLSTTTNPASCGLANGSALVIADPPGEYIYQWNTLQVTPELGGLVPGDYSVSVTQTGTTCQLTATVSISQTPAHYIDIISTTPDSCEAGGEIEFLLSTPGTGPLHVDIIGPPNTFFISLSLSPGNYLLSDFESVLDGPYFFSVYDEQIGDVCKDSIGVGVSEITPLTLLHIDTFTTIPDQPVSGNVLTNDEGQNLQLISVDSIVGGMITFNSDGSFTFTPDPGFTGTATFQYSVLDGCGINWTSSATITVQPVIPPEQKKSIGFYFGPTLINRPVASREKSFIKNSSGWFSGVMCDIQYQRGQKLQQVRLTYIPEWMFNSVAPPGSFEAEYRSELISIKQPHYQLDLAGGIGARAMPDAFPVQPVFMSLHSGVEWKPGKLITLRGEISIRGWKRIERPQLSFSVLSAFTR